MEVAVPEPGWPLFFYEKIFKAYDSGFYPFL